MKQSQRYYRRAFLLGVVLIPFVILTDRALLRQWWFLVPLSVTMLAMFVLTFVAIKHEERGE